MSLASPRLHSFAAGARSLLPLQLYVDHSHDPVLAPATLAALPSTRAMPDRDVFYAVLPKSSIRPVVFFVRLPRFSKI